VCPPEKGELGGKREIKGFVLVDLRPELETIQLGSPEQGRKVTKSVITKVILKLA